MTNGVIAFLAAIGVATWVYTKFNRSTGGNAQSAIVGSGVVGVIVFILVFTLLRFIPE
jgi:hypothetical protein